MDLQTNLTLFILKLKGECDMFTMIQSLRPVIVRGKDDQEVLVYVTGTPDLHELYIYISADQVHLFQYDYYEVHVQADNSVVQLIDGRYIAPFHRDHYVDGKTVRLYSMFGLWRVIKRL
jgi:hypothetical protein